MSRRHGTRSWAAWISTARLAWLAAPLAVSGLARDARAQGIDMTQGGPIQITARDGIEWRQGDQVVIASGDAKAVRANVTVTADRLYAWYRKKDGAAPAPGKPPVGTPPASASSAAPGGVAGSSDTEGNEVYRFRAEGNVHIYTATDQAWGDQATYDLDQAVMVMTGRGLKLTTPDNTLTSRDTLEYWSRKHMAVARGDAVIVTSDARRVAADILVAYTVDGPAPAAVPASGPSAVRPPAPTVNAAPAAGSAATTASKLDHVEAFDNVSVRTQTEIVTGDRGVYVSDTGIARLGGHVRITRGPNQVNGNEAVVNMKTGIATLLSGGGGRVSGLVMPGDRTAGALTGGSPDKAAPPKTAPTAGPKGSATPAPAGAGVAPPSGGGANPSPRQTGVTQTETATPANATPAGNAPVSLAPPRSAGAQNGTGNPGQAAPPGSATSGGSGQPGTRP